MSFKTRWLEKGIKWTSKTKRQIVGRKCIFFFDPERKRIWSNGWWAQFPFYNHPKFCWGVKVEGVWKPGLLEDRAVRDKRRRRERWGEASPKKRAKVWRSRLRSLASHLSRMNEKCATRPRWTQRISPRGKWGGKYCLITRYDTNFARPDGCDYAPEVTWGLRSLFPMNTWISTNSEICLFRWKI